MFRSSAADFQTDRAFGISIVATVICFTSAITAERIVTEKWK
jgi:NitT/TauT family transport system permease protein